MNPNPIKITQAGRARLLHVVDNVLPAEPRRFNMNYWAQMAIEDYGAGADFEDVYDKPIAVQQAPACGTVACLAGWGLIVDTMPDLNLAAATTPDDMLGGLPVRARNKVLRGEEVNIMHMKNLGVRRIGELVKEWQAVHGVGMWDYGDRDLDMMQQGMLLFGMNEYTANPLFVQDWPDEYSNAYERALADDKHDRAVEVVREYVHYLLGEPMPEKAA